MAAVFQCDNCGQIMTDDDRLFVVEPPKIQIVGVAYEDRMFCTDVCLVQYYTAQIEGRKKGNA